MCAKNEKRNNSRAQSKYCDAQHNSSENTISLEQNDSVELNEAKRKKRNKRKYLFLPSFFIFILIVFLLSDKIVNCFVSQGPAYKIRDAISTTLSAESFTIVFNSNLDSIEEITARVTTDPDNGEIIIDADIKGEEDAKIIFYKGFASFKTKNGDWQPISLSGMDTQDEFQMAKVYAFHLYDFIKDSGYRFDMDEFRKSIIYELLEIEYFVNTDKFEAAIDDSLKNFNSNRWLKVNAGFEKKREDGTTYYSFNPNVYKLAASVAEPFEDSIIDKQAKNKLDKFLKEAESKKNNPDFENVSLTIAVNKKYLNSISFEKENGVKFKIAFMDIKKTKINEEKLKQSTVKAYSNILNR